MKNSFFALALLLTAPSAQAAKFWAQGYHASPICDFRYAEQDAQARAARQCGGKARRVSQWQHRVDHSLQPCTPPDLEQPGCMEPEQQCTAGAYFSCNK